MDEEPGQLSNQEYKAASRVLIGGAVIMMVAASLMLLPFGAFRWKTLGIHIGTVLVFAPWLVSRSPSKTWAGVGWAVAVAVVTAALLAAVVSALGLVGSSV